MERAMLNWENNNFLPSASKAILIPTFASVNTWTNEQFKLNLKRQTFPRTSEINVKPTRKDNSVRK